MTKEELCRLMAKTWKDNGGDAMGFHWCRQLIFEELAKLERPSPDTSSGEQNNGR